MCNAVSGFVVLVEMPRALHRLISADRVYHDEDEDPRIAGVYELAARAHEGGRGAMLVGTAAQADPRPTSSEPIFDRRTT